MPRPSSSNNSVDAVASVDRSSGAAGAVAGFASPLVAVASASVTTTADVATAAAATSTSVGLGRRRSAEDAPLAVRLLHNQGFIDGAGGWICGVAQVATGHPLDTIVSDMSCFRIASQRGWHSCDLTPTHSLSRYVPSYSVLQKVRMQLQSATNPMYSSMRDCALKVWRNEGMRGPTNTSAGES
jgi:hypothetical protein